MNREVESPEAETAPEEIDPPVARVESKLPWMIIGPVVILALWFPTSLDLGSRAAGPREIPWIPGLAAETDAGSNQVSLPLVMNKAAMSYFAKESAPAGSDSAESKPSNQNLAGARRVSNIAALGCLLVFFFLGRRVIGDASALVAASLLAVTGPFVEASRSAHPLLIAEALALAGVAWMIGIEARHREVGYTIGSALEISIAGLFFGASLAMHPSTISTVLAAFFLWLFLGMHRSRSTTLPSLRPEASVTFAWVGAAALATLTLATIIALSFIASDSVGELFRSLLPSGYAAQSWQDLYRWIVSPILETDLLVVAAFILIAVIALMEWFAGTHWGAAGLLPWIFLLLFVLLTGNPETSIPLSVPPLLVLGLGWLVLRGFSPARVRRQEYTFLLVWLASGFLLFPIARAIDARLTGEMGHETLASVSLTILPMVLLVAARASRAFWETERGILARLGILLFTCLPVVAGVAELITNSPDRSPSSTDLAIHLQRAMPIALGAAASLGALSVLVSVRPDAIPVPAPASSRGRDHRRRRRHHRGREHSRRPR